MNGVIYKITNLLSGKIYVGQTVNFQHRIHCHKCSNRTGVDAAIKKYGWENFKIEVIEECSIEKLDEREIFWIEKMDCIAPKGYNLTFGGNANRILSDETRAKLSANSKKFKGEKNPFYGKHHTETAKAKNAAAHTGKKHSSQTRAKMSVQRLGEKNAFYGKSHTKEFKFQKSLAKKKILYPVFEKELEKRFLTRKELANKLGMNDGTLTDKLCGRKKLDFKTAEKIKNFLSVDMSIEELFAKN